MPSLSLCVLLLAQALILLPLLSTSHTYTITMLQKLETLESKINLLLLQNTCYKHCFHNLESDCKVDRRALRTIPRNPKKIIEGIQGPSHILFTKMNNAYITARDEGHVYWYSLDGKYLGKFTVPGYPAMTDIWGDTLYTTDSINGVYAIDIRNNTETQKVITVSSSHKSPPVGVKVVDNGGKLLVSLHVNIILVYNTSNYGLIDEIHLGDHPRKMLSDANGFIYVSSCTSRISVLDDKWQVVRVDDYERFGIKCIDGFVINCDGSVILGDRAGKIYFVDKYGKLEKTMEGYEGPGDVDISLDVDHTLWIADTQEHKVYLY